jgi:alpha-tubulin suppressor-like RCC1 family protein
LTKFGTVATWGYGASGCLGHGNYTSFTSPKLVQYENNEYLNDIISLECGGYHTISISSKFKVFSWGRGDVGQLGHYKDQLVKDRMGLVQLKPRNIEFFENVPLVQAACGEAHTLLLDKWGRVWAFGWHQLGQLGVGKISKEYLIHEVKGLPKIAKVYTGAIFSMSISTEGTVHVWGCGENGQLGLGADIKESIVPIKLSLGNELDPKHVIEGICGSSHAIVMTDDGVLYGWGQGTFHSDTESQPKNRLIKSSNVAIKLDYVESVHKYLLKKKTPKVTKQKQYYSRKHSPEKIVEISTLSSHKSDDRDNLNSKFEEPVKFRNNLPTPSVPFKRKPSTTVPYKSSRVNTKM